MWQLRKVDDAEEASPPSNWRMLESFGVKRESLEDSDITDGDGDKEDIRTDDEVEDAV